MQRLKDNWQWLGLNIAAAGIMVIVLLQANAEAASNPNLILVNSGKWAVRFLLLSLAMTPLNTLLGWRGAIRLRKPAGLWAFGFGTVHFGSYIADTWPDWLRSPVPDSYAVLGVIGLTILAAMAATSTRRAMKRMGQWWKRLHRLVYTAGILVAVHALLETSNKRVVMTDARAAGEVQLYMALLAVRIPAIRSAISQLRHRGLAGHPRASRPPAA